MRGEKIAREAADRIGKLPRNRHGRRAAKAIVRHAKHVILRLGRLRAT